MAIGTIGTLDSIALISQLHNPSTGVRVQQFHGLQKLHTSYQLRRKTRFRTQQMDLGALALI